MNTLGKSKPGKVKLRSINIEDAAFIVQLTNDPEVTRFLP